MKTKILLILRILAATILLQTLFFKFTGAPESKFIFQSLGVEPWGRILSGIMELLASILLLVPATQLYGAAIAASIMVGAIFSHIFVLGIVIQDDGGLLFFLACLVLVTSLLILFFQKDELCKKLACVRGEKK